MIMLVCNIKCSQNIIESLESNMPLIRNNLVTVFSSQEFSELQTPEGREILREAALETAQNILIEETGEEGLEQVLFTDFVIQ